jgi:hypothetical protein
MGSLGTVLCRIWPGQYAVVFRQNRLGDGHLQRAREVEIEHVPLVARAIQMRRYDYVRIEHNPDSSRRS